VTNDIPAGLRREGLARSDAFRAQADIPALTGLRGVAALWVVAYHLHEASANGGSDPWHRYALPSASRLSEWMRDKTKVW
jgi:hypothetical protein